LTRKSSPRINKSIYYNYAKNLIIPIKRNIFHGHIKRNFSCVTVDVAVILLENAPENHIKRNPSKEVLDMIGFDKHCNKENNKPYGFPCDVEVKTNHGWKRVDDVSEEQDLLLVASPETLELHYVPLAKKDINPFEGIMAHFQSSQLDLLLPVDAAVFTQRRAVVGGESIYVAKVKDAAEDVTQYDKLPISGFVYECGDDGVFVLPGVSYKKKGKTNSVPEREIPLKSWLEFFGFWLADGCCRGLMPNGKVHSYDVYIKQNDGNEDYILSLMRNIGFEPKIERYQMGGYTNYCIRSRQLWEYLRQFGRSADKFIPEEFLCLAPEYLEALFRGYTNGDSSTDGSCVELSSCSKRLMDNIQELVLKLDGSVAQIRAMQFKRQGGGQSVLWRIRYVPKERRKRKNRATYGAPKQTYYCGQLCSFELEEELGLVLLRNNGTIMWAAC
jgi:hypothetical protein